MGDIEELLSKLMHYNDELTNDDRCDLSDYIEKLQAENAELKKQGQWISVDDGLPSDNGAYWTFNGLDENKTVIQQRVHMYVSDYKYFNSYTVTHWMPLPTPPEGE